MTADSRKLRNMKQCSTDPAYLERMAIHAEAHPFRLLLHRFGIHIARGDATLNPDQSLRSAKGIWQHSPLRSLVGRVTGAAGPAL